MGFVEKLVLFALRPWNILQIDQELTKL